MDSLVPRSQHALPICRETPLGAKSRVAPSLRSDKTSGTRCPLALRLCRHPSLATRPQTFPLSAGATPGRLTLQHVDPNLKFGGAFNAFDLRLPRPGVSPANKTFSSSLRFSISSTLPTFAASITTITRATSTNHVLRVQTSLSALRGNSSARAGRGLSSLPLRYSF